MLMPSTLSMPCSWALVASNEGNLGNSCWASQPRGHLDEVDIKSTNIGNLEKWFLWGIWKLLIVIMRDSKQESRVLLVAARCWFIPGQDSEDSQETLLQNTRIQSTCTAILNVYTYIAIHIVCRLHCTLACFLAQLTIISVSCCCGTGYAAPVFCSLPTMSNSPALSLHSDMARMLAWDIRVDIPNIFLRLFAWLKTTGPKRDTMCI